MYNAARLDWTEGKPARGVAIIAVILGHLLFIQLVQRLRSFTMQPMLIEDERMLQWVEIIERPITMPEPVQSAPSLPNVVRARDEQTPNAPPVIKNEAPPEKAISVPLNAADLRELAALAAKENVEAAEAAKTRYRNFGPRKRPPPPDLAVPSVFPPLPKYSAGDVGENANGDPVVWLNGSCYQELEKNVRTATDYAKLPSDGPPPPKCTIAVGSQEPRGDLFDHIKKQRELPENHVPTPR